MNKKVLITLNVLCILLLIVTIWVGRNMWGKQEFSAEGHEGPVSKYITGDNVLLLHANFKDKNIKEISFLKQEDLIIEEIELMGGYLGEMNDEVIDMIDSEQTNIDFSIDKNDPSNSGYIPVNDIQYDEKEQAKQPNDSKNTNNHSTVSDKKPKPNKPNKTDKPKPKPNKPNKPNKTDKPKPGDLNPKPDPKPEPKPDPKPEPKPEPKPDPEPEKPGHENSDSTDGMESESPDNSDPSELDKHKNFKGVQKND